jgi:hypothetical protein
VHGVYHARPRPVAAGSISFHPSGLPGGVDPLAFLAVPLGDMAVFAALVTAGIWLRRRPDVHKRLMLMAMISILAAAVSRLPVISDLGPLAYFGVTDLFVAACAVYDVATLRRVHRTTALAGLLIVASQPLRLVISGTPVWLAFAKWLTGWVG